MKPLLFISGSSPPFPPALRRMPPPKPRTRSRPAERWGSDDMDFALLPPEINSGRMYAGHGSGQMLAAAAAWNGLASDLQSTAASYQSVVSGLTSAGWLGPSSALMAAAATPYMSWMSTSAMQA